ncbi:hypothetical protein [Pigmentiphaga daeguensis]|uniref:Uncharacterized protein n=1 Tax=Pigmentiphaga daeguensis TaxID=414049 RepID=A0ABN1CZR3_9BURK
MDFADVEEAAVAQTQGGAPAGREPRIRSADLLMTPARMGVMQASRLSVSRLLMAKAIRERWTIERVRWQIDDRARGTALYRIDTGAMPFDFIVHSFEPRMEGRAGRIIGRAWDMMAALVEGPVSERDIRITGEEIPKLYAGRATPGTLIWARSNRSARVFNHTVESLAQGRQPDVPTLADVCYLMRNTGLDGNGTFGTRSFRALESTHPLRRPLDAQMLCAYMMRVFSVDLVNHLAHCASPAAVRLAPEIERFLGVGNASALGLILYVNNHPKLVHHWVLAREQAIVGAKRLRVAAGDAKLALLLKLLDKAIAFRREDRMDYEQFTASADIAADLAAIRAQVQALHDTGTVRGSVERYPLSALCDALDGTVHEEAYETFLGLLTELVPELCDRLAEGLAVDEEYATDPSMSIGHLRDLLHAEYGWAFDIDLESEGASKFVWYKSATAEEPRRGPRAEAGEVFNLGLDLPRLVVGLDREIAQRPPATSVARFLLDKPEYRFIVSRVQTLSGMAFHSPRANIMGEHFVPCEITRFINIGIHGIDKTRDYLQRNLRGVIYQGAPTAADIAAGADPHWFYPQEPVL